MKTPRTKRHVSTNDEVALHVVAFALREHDLNLATLGVFDAVLHVLRLANFLTILVTVAVVLRLDDASGLVGLEVGDDVAPALVVVHADRHGEGLAGLQVAETHGARGAAATHFEDMKVVDHGPAAAVGVVPHHLLDAGEEAAWVGLVDLAGDFVGHAGVEQGVSASIRERCGPWSNFSSVAMKEVLAE